MEVLGGGSASST